MRATRVVVVWDESESIFYRYFPFDAVFTSRGNRVINAIGRTRTRVFFMDEASNLFFFNILVGNRNFPIESRANVALFAVMGRRSTFAIATRYSINFSNMALIYYHNRRFTAINQYYSLTFRYRALIIRDGR